MIFCDSHLHLSDCKAFPEVSFLCSCAHTEKEFILQEEATRYFEGKSILAFGLHPQNPSIENAHFLEELLKEKKIGAIGEAGFDFFTPELRSFSEEQKKAFETCIFLSEKYNVPLIIHARKALDMIFSYSYELKKVPSVIFHSFSFSIQDSLSLIKHGINSYFSFGSLLVRGGKKATSCVSSLPLETLLLETDAPYMASPSAIKDVYEAVSRVRNLPLETLCEKIKDNFLSAFALKG